VTYNPAPVLFRQAMAMSHKANDIATGTRVVTTNPAARIADACIVAIVLGHAAVESAWYHAKAQADLASRGWPTEFDRGLAAVASCIGQPAPPGVDPALWRRFELIQAWRNFLQHGDRSSRERLRKAGGDPDPGNLTAAFAAEAVDVSRGLLKHIGSVTGQDLGSTSWIDPLE